MVPDDQSAAAGLVPIEDGPHRLRMGIRRLDEDRWVDVDDDLADQLALKRELIGQDRARFVLDDRSDLARTAGQELDAAVAAWWSRRAAVVPPPESDDPHPAVRAALRTQEDWCLLAAADGPPRLVAGCVCFPTRWVPTDKVGHTLAAIHGPVDGYDSDLASPVDRFLERLEPGRIVWRANWNLVDDDRLSQPYVPDGDRRLEDGDVGRLVHFRVERQTLRRLPVTGALAFGIRVHQRPMAEFVTMDGAAERLLAAVRALPPATFRYKGLGAFWDRLEAWLEDLRRA